MAWRSTKENLDGRTCYNRLDQWHQNATRLTYPNTELIVRRSQFSILSLKRMRPIAPTGTRVPQRNAYVTRFI
jgi:hypothetical protein